MSKSIVLRLVLVLAAVAVVGAGGYYVFNQEGQAAALREGQRAFDESAARLQVTLADLRAAQAAYLAPDQDRAVWTAQSAKLREQADAQVKRLASATSVPAATSEIATAAESLATLGRLDARIQELLADSQPLTASSLIFSDSLQVSQAASNALAAARGAAATAMGAQVARARELELYAVAGAVGCVVLVLVILVPATTGRRADDDAREILAAARVPGASEAESDAEVTLENLELVPRPRRTEAAATAATRAPERPRPEPAPPADGSVDLLGAARVCTDLARVKDTSELQGLLARAAAVLDASGIVVWMAGNNGELWPAFSYGYGQPALTKMQSLPGDAATPVSAAFRKGALEVVPAENETSGAIVAPILTASGCVGVMAVEIPPGTETRAAEQALAAIIAAQLATLVPGETSA